MEASGGGAAEQQQQHNPRERLRDEKQWIGSRSHTNGVEGDWKQRGLLFGSTRGPRRPQECNCVLVSSFNNYSDGLRLAPPTGGLFRRQQHYHLVDSRSAAGPWVTLEHYCWCCCWLLPAPRTLPELDWRRKLPEEGWRGSGGVPVAGDAARNLLLPAACCRLAVSPPTPTAAAGGLLARLLLPPPAAPSKPRNTITPLPLPLPSAYAASAPPLLPPEPAPPLSEPDRPPPTPPSMLRPKLEPPRKLLE